MSAKTGSAARSLSNTAEHISGSANAHVSEADLALAASATRRVTVQARTQQQKEWCRGLAASLPSKRCAGSLKTDVG